MSQNSKTIELIESAVKEIENNMRKSFDEAGIKFQPNTVFSIYGSRVDISIYDTEKDEIGFGTCINFYAERERFGSVYGAEISFGSTGSFSPEDVLATGRTINAANILTNWEACVNIFEFACLSLRRAEKSIKTKK